MNSNLILLQKNQKFYDFFTDKINKDLIKRILFTLFVLFIFRVGSKIPLVGIDVKALGEIFPVGGTGFFSLINSFSGGALSRLTVFSLGVVPYISASMMIQMSTSPIGIDFFMNLKKSGSEGKARLEKYIHWFSFAIGFSQSLLTCSLILVSFRGANSHVFYINKWLFVFLGVFSLLTGTMAVIWMASQISKKGIGSGTSLIMYTGIISSIPSNIFSYMKNKTLFSMMNNISTKKMVFFLSVMSVLVCFIIFVENIYRIIMIRYTSVSNTFVSNINVQNKFSPSLTHPMPLKINLSGIMAAVMSGIILSFFSYPLSVLQDIGNKFEVLQPYVAKISYVLLKGDIVYNIFYAILLVTCVFAYTPVLFDPQEVAENLKKSHACISGISPGKKTVLYLENVVYYLLYFSSIYLVIICLVPNILSKVLEMGFKPSGTSLLILCSVPIELLDHILSHQKPNYKSILEKEYLTFKKN